MANWTYERCGGELVEIAAQTLTDIRTTIKPNLRTLSGESKDGWWRLCPRCDSYALGMELEVGFPLRTRDGRMTEVHEFQTEGNG